MIRYLFRNARLLFVGINPHHGSYARGVPFSNNKMFWYLLQRARLIEEDVKDLKDDVRLKEIYRRRFNAKYGFGLVNVVNRPTRDVTELRKGEERSGRRRIRNIVEREKPAAVCFVGKIAYEIFSGKKKFSFGWQDDLASSRVFVMHFPLRGKADIRVQELLEVARGAGVALNRFPPNGPR
jgi:double-stranded uracil-DNA glycosylase